MPKLVSRTLAVLGLFLPVPEWWRCNAGNSKSLSLFPSDSVLIFVVYRFFGMWPNTSHLKDIPFPWSSCQSPCLLIAPKHLLLREQRNDFAFAQRPWLISGQTSGIRCPETVPDQRFKPETESGKKWFNTGKKWFEKVNHPKSGFITSFIMWKSGKKWFNTGKKWFEKVNHVALLGGGWQNDMNLDCHLRVHTQLPMLIADKDIAKNPHKTSLLKLIAAPEPSYIS